MGERSVRRDPPSWGPGKALEKKLVGKKRVGPLVGSFATEGRNQRELEGKEIKVIFQQRRTES